MRKSKLKFKDSFKIIIICRAILLIIVCCFLTSGCRRGSSGAGPSIEFTAIPPAAEGGAGRLEVIGGRVAGFRPGQRIVIFAKSGTWWVQPTSDQPFTAIDPDSTWKSSIHLGTEYAALLVEPQYRPPAKTDVLPAVGGGVLTVATEKGREVTPAPAKTIQFSGYDWVARSADSDRGGWVNAYDPANAWTDENGFLHLRIAKRAGRWTGAEVRLARSLGYGSYSFVVHEIAHLPPTVVLGMFTWDDTIADPNHRELDIEITRWGDPASKNAQYVVQPYYVPTNVVRFTAPPGTLTHSFHWEQGRAAFKTVRGNGAGAKAVADHVFTSGIPTSGGESVHLNLYIFGQDKDSVQNEVEVVVEKFQYLP